MRIIGSPQPSRPRIRLTRATQLRQLVVFPILLPGCALEAPAPERGPEDQIVGASQQKLTEPAPEQVSFAAFSEALSVEPSDSKYVEYADSVVQLHYSLAANADNLIIGRVTKIDTSMSEMEGMLFPLTVVTMDVQQAAIPVTGPILFQFYGDPAQKAARVTTATPQVSLGDEAYVFTAQRDGVTWLVGIDSYRRLEHGRVEFGGSVSIEPVRLLSSVAEVINSKKGVAQ